MVSPFTLGLFAPLPLAMMIPFMATQSLAMGEAFGKSFQYGKRKISSMTNEEFNKLTFSDLMDQQTANIKQIIPALHQQLQDSNEMQEKIFQEMTKLIPAFIKGLGAGAEDIINPDNVTTLGPSGPILKPSASENSLYDQLGKLVTSLTVLATTQMLGYKRVSDTPTNYNIPDIIPEIQGPPEGTNNPPPATILDSLKLQKELTQKNLDAQYSHQPPPATEAQLRRQRITESGLSPLAYASREKFKANIDSINKQIASMITTKKANTYSGGQVNPAWTAGMKTLVAKLSALRIKYRSVYGTYY